MMAEQDEQLKSMLDGVQARYDELEAMRARAMLGDMARSIEDIEEEIRVIKIILDFHAKREQH